MSRLGLKKPSKDKECVKVNYEIIIKIAENVPVTGPVYVQWKRGKKNENKGESKHVAVKDKKAIFEEQLEISSTLYKIPKKGYEAKNISITLKEEKGKKGTSIAKTVIDLAEFAGKDEKRSFSLKSKKSKVAPTLTLHFKSKERALAPDEDVTDSEMITEDAASDDEDDVEDFTDDRDDSSTKSGKSTSSATSSSTPATPSKLDKLAEKPPSTPETKPRELSKRDSVNVNALDVEQLRAELERAKKRTKELATENVDYEDKVKELTKELEDAKKSKASPGGLSAEKEADLRKKIKDLTQENSDQAEEIKKLKKANEEKAATVASPGASEKEAQMKQRLKELATENVDLEEQVNSLKKELEAAKSSPSAKKSDKDDGSQKQVQDELRKKIKELTRANEDTEEEVEALKKQVEQLKKAPAVVPVATQGDDSKKLQSELRDKEDRITDLEDQLERLKKKSSSAAADSQSVQEYKDKIDSLKEKLRSEQDESDRKLDEARELEAELRTRIRELEDADSNSKLKSSGSSNRDRQEREKLEREVEKEKDARKKAEKEVRELRDKLDGLKESGRGNGKYAGSSDGDDKSHSLQKELDREKAITSAVYEHLGQYSTSDGVSESALAIFKVLADSGTFSDPDDPEASAVTDRTVEVLQAACECTPNDMNLQFYWLSTTSALLHMLRDEPDVHSNNDRDPIIDGVYQATKEPSSNSDLQDRLEWISYSVYKSLVTIISNKLTPVLAPVIIERQLTDKKTQVKGSSVMRILDRVLARTRHHYLYDAIVQQLFVQIFYFISCHLVNTILQKPKLTPSIGFQIKLGISHLEDWLSSASGSSAERALLAPCQAMLDGLRDVGGVLVLDKGILTDASTLQSIFKVLNLRQIRKLLEIFEPDQLASGGVPSSVRDAMQSHWQTPQAASQPLLFDQSKLLAFSPQFD